MRGGIVSNRKPFVLVALILIIVLIAMPLVVGLMPVNVEAFEVNELPDYKDMDCIEGVSYTNPTPFLNGLPQECVSGGYLCYYEWGVS